MKFSVNWLREFVELPESTAALAELLTLAGVEIEAIEKRGADFEKVVVAQITASSPHPNADRLTVCQVDDGSGKTRQIVCGAKNYKVGDKVSLALPGAILTNDLKIRASKLRGVESEGMLCSAKELGFGEDAAGLLILSPDAQIGASIGSLYRTDTILDVEITPNRSDLLSHLGLAREIAALVGSSRCDDRGRRNAPSLAVAASVSEAGGLPPETAAATIKISALRECPFYSARRIEGIKVSPSPDWLREKIEAVGVRSINNVVDIANLVMLELGQPMHAFDADKLQGEINVRLAHDGEKFLALDGKTYLLGKDNLVIADAERAVAIAGVMGGEETGVTDVTRNVLLESAYFLPSSVRRTARSLNLPSDASYRFERGVDPGMILRASARATQLILEIAAGKPAAEIAAAGSLPAAPPNVRLRSERCDQLIGATIGRDTIDRILEGFGLTKAEERDEETAWQIPTYRSDLRREADLIEEIVRAYGIDRVPGRDRSRFTPTSRADFAYDFASEIGRRLAARGLFEARTSALIPRGSGSNAFREKAIELRNPLSEDHVALRPSLIPGLLGVLARNLRQGALSVRLFELGRIFSPPGGGEEQSLALLFCGKSQGAIHWRMATQRQLDFFDLKGVIESLQIPALSFRRSENENLALGASVYAGDKLIGFAGQLSAARARALDAGDPVLVAEIQSDFLFKLNSGDVVFRELEKFPSVTRDVAMLVPDALTHSEIMDAIRSAQEPLLEQVALFDLFSGEGTQNVGPGRKSLAYTLTYRDQNRTLTHDEVSAAHDRIRERLKRELSAELRE
ncbi:MAG: phenylalanine--tRNA ligase subunit beta [Verrucomicrobiota bacterium]